MRRYIFEENNAYSIGEYMHSLGSDHKPSMGSQKHLKDYKGERSRNERPSELLTKS